MVETLRDDIWYRGSYRPSADGEYRVMLSDHGVWLVDRASFDRYGKLSWYAQDHDTLAYRAALNGFAQMRQLSSTAGMDTGFFIPEQLCQLAANIAGRRAESHGDTPVACGELARAMVQTMVAMPLTQAVTNLVQAELMTDTAAAVQAQLLLHAAYQSNNRHMSGRAIELRQTGKFTWLDAQDLSEYGELTQRLNLSSPDLITLLRRDLSKQQVNDNGLLASPWCHFAESTPVSEAIAWLDHAANLPVELERRNGSICVVENWITGEPEVFVQDGTQLKPVESEYRVQAALMAYVSARNNAQSVTGEGNLNVLQQEAIGQRAAHLSRYQLAPAEEAAKKAALLAYKEATTYYQVNEELWTPLEEAEATENVSGTLRMRDLSEQISHQLTSHGVAHMVGFYKLLANTLGQDDVQYRKLSDSVAFQVAIPDHQAQLSLKTTPLSQLAVVGTLFGANNELLDQMNEDNRPFILQAANLAHYDFIADDGPAFAHETPHRYTLKLVTERREGGDSFEEPEVDEGGDETLEADEVIRLVRDKGITRSPTIVQYGDGSWRVSYSSEAPEENRAYFERGIETYYTLHLVEVNGQPVNPENAQVFAEDVGLRFHNPYEPKAASRPMPRFG